jgi:type IV pilus assembly protein PilB
MDVVYHGRNKENESQNLIKSGEVSMKNTPKTTKSEVKKTKDAGDAFEQIMVDAYKKRATTIHLQSTSEGGLIRFRIDGVLHSVQTLDKMTCENAVRKAKAMGCMNLDEQRVPQDGRIQLSVEGKRIDFRVSAVPSLYGEDVTIRILSADTKVPLDKLCYSPAQREILDRWMKKSGLILVTGPTGSGKTTSLYGIMNELNQDSVKICSIEDPVEYVFPGLTQIRVNPSIGVTFARLLRACLRQDPDVLMVGEIRDLETLKLTVESAITGHLVLSSLHTDNATSAVIRLLDLGLEPFLVRHALTGVTAQRLVRKLCPECKEKHEPENYVRKAMKIVDGSFYRPGKCAACNQTGYKGRIAVYEMFELSEDAEEILGTKPDSKTLRRHAVSKGMTTMWQDGITKAKEGLTSIEELIRVLGSPD